MIKVEYSSTLMPPYGATLSSHCRRLRMTGRTVKQVSEHGFKVFIHYERRSWLNWLGFEAKCRATNAARKSRNYLAEIFQRLTAKRSKVLPRGVPPCGAETAKKHT